MRSLVPGCRIIWSICCSRAPSVVTVNPSVAKCTRCGGINAYTTFDRTVYYIDAPSTAFEGAVDILADIVLHSTLPEAEVERERDVILREIDMGLDDPDRQLSQALFRTAYQRHPYREPVIGHRELFEQVTREELWAYYKARYVPNNMVVSIVGAVDSRSCEQAVEQAFGPVPRGRLAPVQIQEEPVQLAARREDIVGSYNIFRGGLGLQSAAFEPRRFAASGCFGACAGRW